MIHSGKFTQNNHKAAEGGFSPDKLHCFWISLLTQLELSINSDITVQQSNNIQTNETILASEWASTAIIQITIIIIIICGFHKKIIFVSSRNSPKQKNVKSLTNIQSVLCAYQHFAVTRNWCSSFKHDLCFNLKIRINYYIFMSLLLIQQSPVFRFAHFSWKMTH